MSPASKEKNLSPWRQCDPAHHESLSSSVVRAPDRGAWEDMGTSPLEDSVSFSVPRSWHTKSALFSYFMTELKIYNLSFFTNILVWIIRRLIEPEILELYVQ